jgi:hypothetical protein
MSRRHRDCPVQPERARLADQLQGAVALLGRAMWALQLSEAHDDNKAELSREIDAWLSAHTRGQ